jgi:hypothetical protein
VAKRKIRLNASPQSAPLISLDNCNVLAIGSAHYFDGGCSAIAKEE